MYRAPFCPSLAALALLAGSDTLPRACLLRFSALKKLIAILRCCSTSSGFLVWWKLMLVLCSWSKNFLPLVTFYTRFQRLSFDVSSFDMLCSLAYVKSVSTTDFFTVELDFKLWEMDGYDINLRPGVSRKHSARDNWLFWMFTLESF